MQPQLHGQPQCRPYRVPDGPQRRVEVVELAHEEKGLHALDVTRQADLGQRRRCGLVVAVGQPGGDARGVLLLHGQQGDGEDLEDEEDGGARLGRGVCGGEVDSPGHVVDEGELALKRGLVEERHAQVGALEELPDEVPGCLSRGERDGTGVEVTNNVAWGSVGGVLSPSGVLVKENCGQLGLRNW